MTNTEKGTEQIDEASDDWMVFAGQFYVFNGFQPNPRDSHVRLCWLWFRNGVRWQSVKSNPKKRSAKK